MSSIQSRNVLFITGAFVSHSGWDPWQAYFKTNGFASSAPPWPHKDAPANLLRSRHPDPAVASIRLNQLVDHYAVFAHQLPEKPILIGHSLGGLVTQILVNRGLAAAGIAIHSVPPQGVIPYEFSFLKAGWKSLGFFTSAKKTYLMSFSDWQYAFTNGMSLADQKETYEKNVVPESKLVIRDGLTAAAKLDFAKPHVPLLFLSGNKDHIMPATLNFRNFKKYSDKESVTGYKIFEGSNHFVVGQSGWKGHADYIIDWLATH